jgi:hypothetical protein
MAPLGAASETAQRRPRPNMKTATRRWLFGVPGTRKKLLLLFGRSSGGSRSSTVFVLASGLLSGISRGSSRRSRSRGRSRSFFFATGSQSSGQQSGQDQRLFHVDSSGFMMLMFPLGKRSGASLFLFYRVYTTIFRLTKSLQNQFGVIRRPTNHRDTTRADKPANWCWIGSIQRHSGSPCQPTFSVIGRQPRRRASCRR